MHPQDTKAQKVPGRSLRRPDPPPKDGHLKPSQRERQKEFPGKTEGKGAFCVLEGDKRPKPKSLRDQVAEGVQNNGKIVIASVDNDVPTAVASDVQFKILPSKL